ncbi:Hypothetical protein KVN_LOCUS100 [uncultured virus]|nr:Hypothetical protein KVN_LOCUS100 [uncultured virus]
MNQKIYEIDCLNNVISNLNSICFNYKIYVENLDKEIDNLKLRRDFMKRQLFNLSNEIYPCDNQFCTCEQGTSEFKYIKCKKHLSKYFENQGCKFCNYTDCSNNDCLTHIFRN